MTFILPVNKTLYQLISNEDVEFYGAQSGIYSQAWISIVGEVSLQTAINTGIPFDQTDFQMAFDRLRKEEGKDLRPEHLTSLLIPYDFNPLEGCQIRRRVFIGIHPVPYAYLRTAIEIMVNEGLNRRVPSQRGRETTSWINANIIDGEEATVIMKSVFSNPDIFRYRVEIPIL